MKELKVLNHDGTLVVGSREVAEMVGMRHADLLEKVNGYKQYLANGKFRSLDFFIESTYSDEQGKPRPCYLLTRKGCDMVANKMTGEKGVLFTAAYVDKFYEMEEKLRYGTEPKVQVTELQKQVAETNLLNARASVSSIWMKLGDMLNTPEHKQLCAAYCSQVLTGGQMVLPLPQVERTYSAQEVADMYGITANRVGRIANENGLKTAKYGQLVLDVAKHCQGKAVQSFRYNETGARAIGKYVRN